MVADGAALGPAMWWFRLAGVVGLTFVALLLGSIGPGERVAAACPSAGGADSSFVPSSTMEEPGYALRIVGGGWGHAIGMSQYGARGAAELGCSPETILATYYRGTSVENRSDLGETVRVGFFQKVEEVFLIPQDGAVEWHHCAAGDACPTDDTEQAIQERGETWRVSSASDGEFVVESVDGDGETTTVFDGVSGGHVRVVHEGTVIAVQNRASGPSFRRLVRWGHHRFIADDADRDRLYSVQHVTSGDGHTGMERYLWGVAEVPASWPTAALQVQAITARSFAANRIGLASRFGQCRCDLRPTTADQHYTGWTKESEGTDAVWGERWKSAVNATAGRVVTYLHQASGERRIADTFYSSSTGGYTENSEDVWAAEISYLRSVDTTRWEEAGNNPFHRWEARFTFAELESAFGLDAFTSFRVLHRGDGGRPVSRLISGGSVTRQAGAEVRGVRDGQPVTLRYSAEQLRSILGLRSGLVYPVTRQPTAIDRWYGQGRVETAVAVSANNWPSAASVVIARADDPADALAGTALAGDLDAPLLITPTDGLDEAVGDEVRRLGAHRAVLLGGENALSSTVEDDLRDAGVDDIERIAGDGRAATAAAIAARLAPAAGGTALLVHDAFGPGDNWADALSVSGLAARQAADGSPWPVLLATDRLPRATRDALDAHDVAEVWIVGGTAVIPDSVKRELEDLGYDVVRRAGPDRYATSREIFDRDGARGPVIAVTGAAFPDGLAAGALAARHDASVLLVRPDTLNRPTGHRKWIRDEITRWPPLVVVGGTSAVSDAVAQHLREELRLR